MRGLLILTTFLFILFFSSKLGAQGPGYLNKKMLIGYGLNTSPALWGSDARNNTISGTEGNAKNGKMAFNIIHEGFLEYATSAKWIVGFCTRYYKTTFDNATMMVDGYGGVEYPNRTTPMGYYSINGLSYCLYFKLYDRRYVAPWGKYIMFGPVLNTAKASYDPEIMHVTAQTGTNNNYLGYYNKHDTLITDFGPREQSYKGYNIMFGFGKSRIIANRLVFDYGCNMYLLSFFPNIALTYKEGITASNYISKTINRRVRGINHFNVFVKVGVLLF